jgi:dTDP-4-amino-4,6-dideoxygalactose transaminase
LEALDAIYLVGATPIPVDIGRKSFLPDVEKVNEIIQNESPKLFILDHPFGGIHSVNRYSLGDTLILEDITEALGWGETSIPVGKQGQIAVCGLSFENTITTGSGAFLLTEDSKIHETILEKKSRTLRKPGIAKLDCNLIDYQAALGIEQIGKLGVLVERKRKIAQVYLQSVSQTLEIETYFSAPEEDSFSRFPILIPKLAYEEANRYFRSLQIGTHRIHEEPIHKILSLESSQFLNAERLFQRGHCLPLYPNLTKDNIQRIATSLRRIY